MRPPTYTVLYGMKQKQSLIGQTAEMRSVDTRTKETHSKDFVLEKSIFTNVFDKDIRRVFIYKKSERLAKALRLISPAFAESVSLRNRIDTISLGLVDAAVLPLGRARTDLSRELLALSSILSIARTSGLLSHMNADLIAREVHGLLQEVAAYEEPRFSLDEIPTLSDLTKSTMKQDRVQDTQTSASAVRQTRSNVETKRPIEVKDNKSGASKAHIKDRREAVMSVIQSKGSASIKDISTLIRDVSEKTIQRELSALVDSGTIIRRGERRWSVYSLA